MLLRSWKLYRVQSGLVPGNVWLCAVCGRSELINYLLPAVLQVSRSSSNASQPDAQQFSDDAVSAKQVKSERKSVIPSNSRYIYPEFLPDPKMEWRNSLREKLERLDMIQRRKHIDIPEFYVGMH